MLEYIIQLNGIYDILCALCMLHIIDIPGLGSLHLSMLREKPIDAIMERFYGYWIFTNGVIRLSNHVPLIIVSYILEGIFYWNELSTYDSVYLEKTVFVILSSWILASLCYVYYRTTHILHR